ncbi:hypothetical protein [Synechococcus sp. PCC 7336]|uniref:hypothetical protein n=1 Tax=Synechococcus sp. PCC 7336 TaxID=195250 RepID=UPI000348C360|nr:hypothetical protein [Synechococcus sp. PCC 7336]
MPLAIIRMRGEIVESYITSAGKQLWGSTRKLAIRAADSAIQTGTLALDRGSLFLGKARVLISDTFSVAADSLKSRR